MTNEQLYVLRQADRRNLQSAIQEAERLLPEQSERRQVHSVPPFGISATCNFGRGPCPDNHYIPGQFAVLTPFEELLAEMDEQLALLKGETDATN